MKRAVNNKANEAGSSQKEMLFRRGKAMSGAPIMSGTIQLPKPPIIAGIPGGGSPRASVACEEVAPMKARRETLRLQLNAQLRFF